MHVLPKSMAEVSTPISGNGFLMIPHNSSAKLHAEISPRLSDMEIVSEWWLEKCLQSNLLVDPKEDLLSRPLPTQAIDGLF